MTPGVIPGVTPDEIPRKLGETQGVTPEVTPGVSPEENFPSTKRQGVGVGRGGFCDNCVGSGPPRVLYYFWSIDIPYSVQKIPDPDVCRLRVRILLRFPVMTQKLDLLFNIQNRF